MLSMVKMLSFLIAVCLITTTTYYWVIKTVYYGDHKFVIHDYDLHAFQHSLIETEDRKVGLFLILDYYFGVKLQFHKQKNSC